MLLVLPAIPMQASTHAAVIHHQNVRPAWQNHKGNIILHCTSLGAVHLTERLQSKAIKPVPSGKVKTRPITHAKAAPKVRRTLMKKAISVR